MIRFLMRGDYILRAAVIAIAVAAFPEPSTAETPPPPNISVETENVLNLLQPFLNLNSTAIGQQTLNANLQQAVLINQNTSNTAILNSPSQINPNVSATLLNGNLPTSTLAALAISDENSLGAISTQLYGTTTLVGPAANIAGALPTQNTTSYTFSNSSNPSNPPTVYTNGAQQYGAFGSVLGQAYVNGVSPSSPNSLLTPTITLLTDAFSFTGNLTSNGGSPSQGDISVAKSYFANGTINNTTTAVAPNGYSLPTSSNGLLPSTTSSVYDKAYGNVTNGANVTNSTTSQYGSYKQNSYGDSHPYQTYGFVSSSYTLYDPSVAYTPTGGTNTDKPSANAAFPSAHMAYAMTDALLLGMLVPQTYQSTLLRASEIGESRIVVGVHYPTDIIASRAAISYDLAQFLSNPAYTTAAVTGSTGNNNATINMPALFNAAQPGLQNYLNGYTGACGGSIAACAANTANSPNPYAPSSTNAQVYAARLTYGLPTLTFAQAARESAPAGGPDASILLATLYGGSTTAAQTLAPTGGMYGNLSTNTINQIIVNTETNAMSGFYGTSLSYWSRINLYDAAGYFGGVTGTLTLGSSDQVNTNVVVAGTTTNVNNDVVPAGVLAGTGTINGNVTVNSGGTVSPGDAPGVLTITGNYTQLAGGIFNELIIGPPTAGAGSSYSQLDVSGLATLDGTLNITTENGFSFGLGELFTIILFGSESGDFASLYLNGNACSLISSDLWSCGLYQFGLVDPSGTLDLVVDAAPTPLPSTWTMMLIGLAGLGFVGYRQSRKGVLTAAV